MDDMSPEDLKLIEFHVIKESALLKNFYDKINDKGLSLIIDSEVLGHEDRALLIKKITTAFCPNQTMKLLRWEKELSLVINKFRKKISQLKTKGYESSVNPFNFNFEISQFGKTVFSTEMKTMDDILQCFPIKYDESLYLFIAMLKESEALSTIREVYIFVQYLKSLKT
jgi:hypothetical protein